MQVCTAEMSFQVHILQGLYVPSLQWPQHMHAHSVNPLPTNGAHVASWTLRKPIGIYMGDLILGVIFQYMLLAVSYGW